MTADTSTTSRPTIPRSVSGFSGHYSLVVAVRLVLAGSLRLLRALAVAICAVRTRVERQNRALLGATQGEGSP
jgi:hypothetical protein